MDAQSIRNDASRLTEWLAAQIELDGENGAGNAKYTIGYTNDHTKRAVVKQVHQIGDMLKCDYRMIVEGYFMVVQQHGQDLEVSIFLVYKRPNPTHL